MESNNQTRSEEDHPNWYKDVPGMRTLILGSYPPHEKSRDYPFYYPNSQNRFWDILADVSGTKLQYRTVEPEKAVEERFEIMKSLDSGVQNLGLKILRKGESARDTDIEITVYQDILGIIRKHDTLERILLPGFSAKNSTYRAFIRYLGKNGFQVEELKKPTPGETKFDIQVNGINRECIVLNSTSTAARIKYPVVLAQFEKWIVRN